MPDDYEYDIFISYRRHDADWIRWTRENFAATIATLLAPSRGKVPIFIDDQLDLGQRWPDELARKLARSRVLIPLLCPDYFRSAWCKLELHMMYRREQELRKVSGRISRRLILPFVLNDGDSFPAEVRAIQSVGIHRFANPTWRPETRRHAKFSDVIFKHCPDIERALNEAPRFQPAWEEFSLQGFQEMFDFQVQEQTVVPALSLTGSDGHPADSSGADVGDGDE